MSGTPAEGLRTAPPSVVNAARLMIAGAVLQLIPGVLVVLSRDEMLAATIEDNAEAEVPHSPEFLQASVDSYVVGTLILTGLAIALWLWMAWANTRGRRWARVVATVLGGLNVVLTPAAILANPGTASLANVVLGVASAALAAVILVLLYRPDARAFFAADPKRRPPRTSRR